MLCFLTALLRHVRGYNRFVQVEQKAHKDLTAVEQKRSEAEEALQQAQSSAQEDAAAAESTLAELHVVRLCRISLLLYRFQRAICRAIGYSKRHFNVY